MKIKKTLFIQAVKKPWSKDFTVEISTYQSKSDCHGIYIDIDQEEVEIECPEFSQSDFIKGHVDQLREVRRKHLVESQQKTKLVDEQIENLLALENKS